MIFTLMWCLDQPMDWIYVERISNIFKREGADVYYVELHTTKEERLKRNTTENRLRHKPSKRDTEASRERLLSTADKFRCVSYDGEITFENYMKIDNSDIPADVVARMIKERFML